MAFREVGQSIPPNTAHVEISASVVEVSIADISQAVSVSLPTWEANVGYEEGDRWVLSRMTTGYPRCAKFRPRGNGCQLRYCQILHS